MLDKIYLFILKMRLKRYKRDAKYYEKIGNYNNWYHEWGIPELTKEIINIKVNITLKEINKYFTSDEDRKAIIKEMLNSKYGRSVIDSEIM